jgi:hypothetical protein
MEVLAIKLYCKSCGGPFEGRPNRRYCSNRCRRRGEKKARLAKSRMSWENWLETLPPGEREFWGGIPEFSTEGLAELGELESIKI